MSKKNRAGQEKNDPNKAVSAGSALDSPKPQDDKYDSDCKGERTKSNLEYQTVSLLCEYWRSLRRPETAIALVGVVVLIFYTYYARQQAKAAYTSLELASRAWVTAKNIRQDKTIPNNPRFYLVLENSGRSPAIGSGRLYSVLLPQGVAPSLQPNETASTTAIEGFVVGTGQEFSINIPLDFTMHVEAIGSGKRVLYVLGRVDYRDGFTNPRWTTYCFQFAPHQRREAGELFGLFNFCKTGNDAR